MARPTKLTPALQRRLCALLRDGVLVETAALVAGIAPSTHFDWMAKGREAKSGVHHAYVEAVEKALAEAESNAVKLIRRAGKGDWRAAAWYLERQHSDRWSKPTVPKRAPVAGGQEGDTDGDGEPAVPSDQSGL